METAPHLVFSQTAIAVESGDEHRVVAVAQAHFRAAVAFPVRRYREGAAELEAQATFPPVSPVGATSSAPNPATFRITARARSEDDLARARAAEIRGKAGGMASLAERCPSVWEITSDDAGPRDTWLFCGVLAAALLGPVLPPDDSTLMGVRGARLRAEATPHRR